MELIAIAFDSEQILPLDQPKLRHYGQGRKNYDFWRKLQFYLKCHLMVGQTTMYLVSLESSSKIQENGV